ncbi:MULTISPECIES: nucleotidyltransferase family protein [unclassified Rhizobium]|uniref:nucleotidyltransferase family protein n=1 Tax=unclassified Rhizobium TaxID=2613769 RepID=UPI00161F46CB|nr:MULTISPECIES: nucleotidyltransferase domain-containing protein [unclassified Rhizobium]
MEAAFACGSVARGSDRPDSDVDLMVVGDVDMFDLGPVLQRLQQTLGREEWSVRYRGFWNFISLDDADRAARLPCHSITRSRSLFAGRAITRGARGCSGPRLGFEPPRLSSDPPELFDVFEVC